MIVDCLDSTTLVVRWLEESTTHSERLCTTTGRWIWHFSFTAEAPEGIVPQVMAPIEAVYVMEDVSDEFKGVRVIAETNYIEVVLR